MSKKTDKKIEFTDLPLTCEQAEQMKDKEGFVKVVMPITLDELSKGADYCDELVSDKIGGDDLGFCLEDLSYRLLGGSGQEAIVEVTCNVDHWLDVQGAV